MADMRSSTDIYLDHNTSFGSGGLGKYKPKQNKQMHKLRHTINFNSYKHHFVVAGHFVAVFCRPDTTRYLSVGWSLYRS